MTDFNKAHKMINMRFKRCCARCNADFKRLIVFKPSLLDFKIIAADCGDQVFSICTRDAHEVFGNIVVDRRCSQKTLVSMLLDSMKMNDLVVDGRDVAHAGESLESLAIEWDLEVHA